MVQRIVDHRKVLPFHAWRRDVHSQCGEDGIIENLLAAIGRSGGYFVEFGAWDGRHLSNTAKLADEGWRGCFIEGDGERFKDLQAGYAARPDLALVNAYVGAAGPNALDSILDRVGAPQTIDVLSIDIDGNDYHVWKSLTRHSADLVVVEFNPSIPAHVIYFQEYDPAVNRGASLAAFDELAAEKGYALVAATDWNAFFLKKELVAAHGIATYTPAEVKSTEHEAAIFHGFDGTIMVAGNRNLIWHGVSYAENELQVLPESLRKIPVGQPTAYFEEFQRFKHKRSA